MADDFTAGGSCRVADSLIISVSEVQDRLSKINIKQATGPDNIRNWIPMDCAPLLAGPLCVIFDCSLRDGRVPSVWKSRLHLPLSNVNHQPISLNKVLTKIIPEFVTWQWVMSAIFNTLTHTNMAQGQLYCASNG